MILQKFSYIEYENSPRNWELSEFELNNINLIVGNNASGKSRTLNVIHGLSKLLLAPKIIYNAGTYKSCFKKGKYEISYCIELNNGIVVKEEMFKDKKQLIKRDINGVGEIYNSSFKQMSRFKIPQNELVACRRDEIQYPYLEDFFQWASNTRHFRFSKDNDKLTLALIESNKTLTEDFNLKESNQAIEIFRVAKKRYNEKFTSMLIKDFNSIGYSVTNIEIGKMHSVKLDSNVGNTLIGLRAKEKDREGYTDQNEMSDGMFRALSILIHYNFYILEKKNFTILIDDIGEGLDFERSTKLIELLIRKSSKNFIQLLMSTNDKFIMNNTNLKYWQVISRKGGHVHMYNQYNSKNEFDDFKFTGLNNFDFFSTDFFKNGFEK